MRENYDNNLLEKYNSQVDGILTENEKKLHEEYSFYRVYEIEVGPVEAEGGICCPICLFAAAIFFFFGMDCGTMCGCFSSGCSCCCTECGGDVMTACGDTCGEIGETCCGC